MQKAESVCTKISFVYIHISVTIVVCKDHFEVNESTWTKSSFYLNGNTLIVLSGMKLFSMNMFNYYSENYYSTVSNFVVS